MGTVVTEIGIARMVTEIGIARMVTEIGIARMVDEREEEEETGREDHGGGGETDPEGAEEGEGERSSGRLIQVCIGLLCKCG